MLSKDLLVLRLSPSPGYLETDALFATSPNMKVTFVHKTPPNPLGASTSPKYESAFERVQYLILRISPNHLLIGHGHQEAILAGMPTCPALYHVSLNAHSSLVEVKSWRHSPK